MSSDQAPASPAPHLVFVYGTLKRGHGNNRLLKQGNATYLGDAYTARHFIMYDGGFPRVAEIAEIPRDPVGFRSGGHITGELWSCDSATLAHLDSLEGTPTFYRRQDVVVMLGNTPVVAGMYIIQNPNGMPMKPDEQRMLTWESPYTRNRPKPANDTDSGNL